MHKNILAIFALVMTLTTFSMPTLAGTEDTPATDIAADDETVTPPSE